ncbi:MAG: hypothetical protein FJY86_02860 [Candidatus Diapherotrites archaeon]|uniref:Uncharacterized protein n=1 Tax=Candidatus Iainarchaeum sp. TaxID=3101447 RepID=A0A8T4C7T1_9ARCH|nr:hypothetical protein [Candidatus Diapherotrites archaeon]
MNQPIGRKDTTMVGLIAWTFEITRKKNGTLREPKFIQAVLARNGINTGGMVATVHDYLTRLVRNPTAQFNLADEVMEKLGKTANNIRSNKSSPARTKEQQNILQFLKRRMTKQNTAPPASNVTGILQKFLDEPAASKETKRLRQALGRFADSGKPTDHFEEELFETIKKSGLEHEVTATITKLRAEHAAKIHENASRFSIAYQRFLTMQRESNKKEFGRLATPRTARTVNEFNTPLIHGENWEAPAKKKRRKPNVRRK